MKKIDDQNKLTIVQKVAGGGKTTLLLEYVHKARVDWGYSQKDVWAITYAKKLANELTEIESRTNALGNCSQLRVTAC